MSNIIRKVFGTALRFLKSKPFAAAIPAAILGVAAATAVTAIVVKHYKSGAPQRYFALSASSSASDNTSDLSSKTDEIPVVAPPVEQPVNKNVSYKGKNIKVPKVEVAKANSQEDNKNGKYTKEKASKVPMASGITISECKGPKNYTYGIDVSSHNGSIDWAAVKQSGVQFAMIRCGYRGWLTGKIVMDACFEYNIQNAYSNGIPVGVYFYSTATNETEAIQEAAYVVELIKTQADKGIRISYPIAYDFEEFYNTDDRSRAKALSKAQISSDAAAFLDYIKSSGYSPLFYAGKSPIKNNFEQYLTSKYNVWLANYANATEYEGKFFMWQFTSSGQVDGIGGRVDLNVRGFENNDNLLKFSICNTPRAVAYKAPSASSETVLTLSTNEMYLYRNTYNANFKELKIDGQYCYVSTSCLSAPFAAPTNQYTTGAAEEIYKYPVADNSYKTGGAVPAGTALDVRGIWGTVWAEIKYGGSICYIKADKLITGAALPSEIIPSVDTSSNSSGSSLNSDASTNSSDTDSGGSEQSDGSDNSTSTDSSSNNSDSKNDYSSDNSSINNVP
ncbi:MAG: glycoside hydrolase family 25 protein [Clostridia bacterium]|nr:glycoside hydrolase family 25 protein [Clostridia bacterium]